MHISSGHKTVMADIKLFSLKVNSDTITNKKQELNWNWEINHKISQKFSFEEKYEYCEEISNENKKNDEIYFAFLNFQIPLQISVGSLVIGSKLDANVNLNSCRLAFYGNILENIDLKNAEIAEKIKISREKIKQGIIEKIIDDRTLLVKNLFKKESNIDVFKKYPIELVSTGKIGKISSTFGKSGKVKIVFNDGFTKNGDEEYKENEIVNSVCLLKYTKYFSYLKKKIIKE